MAGDQVAVGHRVNAPVLDLGKGGAEVNQFVLDEKGDYLRQANFVLLTIGEARNLLALNQRLAVWRLDVMQRSRGMTHQGQLAYQRRGRTRSA